MSKVAGVIFGRGMDRVFTDRVTIGDDGSTCDRGYSGNCRYVLGACGGMEITEEMLAAIPPGNVLRPLDEFGAFWQLAEDECVRLVLATPMGQTSRELSYASAAMKTARWLAACEVDLGPEHAPLATSTGMELGHATPKTIGVAHEEAGALLLLSPDGYKTPGMPPRPGYLEGVRAVIDWAWRYGPPPQLGGQRSESAPSQ